MAPQELEGDTLGEKHRNYNNKLREGQHSLADNDDSDINNLLKIDVACRSKDVEYLLNVLRSNDMLCISRVIAQSTWLITDKEYENIINPDYLQSNLYPNMTTKAITKFKKHIRLNIKDESRAEQFYTNETNKVEASKWLPHCSVAFIESHVVKHVGEQSEGKSMKFRLFKRLCEKSITIFEIILKNLNSYESREYLQVVTFFLKTNPDKYLDVMENVKYGCGYTKLTHKATELIMKHNKNRIIDKMEKYIAVIHIPTFVKYLEVDEIKNFLYQQAKKDYTNHEYRDLRRLFQYETLKHFIRRLPKDDQFDFVKKECMRSGNNVNEIEMLNTDSEDSQMKKLCNQNNRQPYVWYQFAAFDQAFDEITKLISSETDNKRDLFSVLIKCTKYNLEHIQTVLQYYIKKHKNEDASSKSQFVTEIINHTYVSKYDEKTWNILNTLLKSMNIYDVSSDQSSTDLEIVNFIIIYNALNGQETAEVIEKQFRFDTLKSYRAKMSEAQQNKMFNYLYKRESSKLNSPIADAKDFTESVKTLENMLNLLNDWGKTLLDYPLILNKIQELIKLKKTNSWKDSLSSFYNINKSWRKQMFEESVDLCPNEEVCLNAMKHEPQLLVRHKEAIDALKKEDKVSLTRLLAKLRLYWPHSLAQEWTDVYLNNINDRPGQEAAVRGICAMLPQKPLIDIIEKYKPIQPKIDWKQTDDRVLSIQRLIAKNMHRARPQPTPDAILLYAKGDYLQYSLPALFSIFHNLTLPVAVLYIQKLLDAPVSLQKHGIRFAFKRLDHEKLKTVFLNCWKASKNASIRAIIFKYTHELLCNEKDTGDDSKAASLWELLDLFIDNLNFAEDKEIYKLFSQVENVPINIRAKYIIKSYNFLQKLIPNLTESDRSHYQWISSELARHSRIVMETISSDFVTSIIQEFIDEKFFNSKFATSISNSNDIVKVISAYLLCSKNENEQIKKYEDVFVPIMRRSFEKWDEKSNGIYFVRQNFEQLLSCLSNDLKDYVAEKKLMIPLKMFTLVMAELEKSLSVTENYIILTKWKLTVALAKLTQEHPTENNKIIPLEFGKVCLDLLKNDVALHFPCIYILFSICVKKLFNLLTTEDAVLDFFVSLLSDNNFIQGYLSAIEIGLEYRRDEQYSQIWKQIAAHPSVEVKMHYYDKIEEQEIYV